MYLFALNSVSIGKKGASSQHILGWAAVSPTLALALALCEVEIFQGRCFYRGGVVESSGDFRREVFLQRRCG